MSYPPTFSSSFALERRVDSEVVRAIWADCGRERSAVVVVGEALDWRRALDDRGVVAENARRPGLAARDPVSAILMRVTLSFEQMYCLTKNRRHQQAKVPLRNQIP